jgi:hypothetical protein
VGEKKTLVHRAASKGRSLLVSFLMRWGVWTVVLGAIASGVAQATWPLVYDEFGLPLGIGESGTYKAVEFGVLVTSVFGAAAVAAVGTLRRG